MPHRHLRKLVPLLVLLGVLASSSTASAFCGFYVSGADAKLTNNATMVVMMRDGMRTVLSMQNNYEGPPEDFAMVIPVPIVLKEENVKTLDPTIFDKVDKMASPRLVEYWEQDPCHQDDYANKDRPMPTAPPMATTGAVKKDGGGVKIEAQFKVGEYEVVVLSATESNALDKWLRANKYNIPAGAEPVLRPYIEGGMYFFVAKVDVKKVQFADGRARLSPLRFHYDAKEFSLPIRLGLLNANGAQDLVVHILARSQRYEVANYKNATIPTNIDVADDVRTRFAEFYAALFDKTLEKNDGAVVTEYAWDAGTCDPCPGPTLNGGDFLTLGADTLPDKPQWGFVLTRLHARYTKEQAKEDLVFQAAAPIIGGREVYMDANELEQGAKPSGVNNFQGRYAIRHPWTGKIECQTPVRGRWGGPPDGKMPSGPTSARDTAFVTRGQLQLPQVVRRDIPEVDVKAKVTTHELMNPKAEETPTAPTGTTPDGTGAAPPAEPSAGGEGSGGGCAITHGRSVGLGGLWLLLVVVGLGWRRR